MSPTRRIISFICALGLTIGGGLWMWFELFAAQHPLGKMALGAGFVMTLGVCWLWADFVSPGPKKE